MITKLHKAQTEFLDNFAFMPGAGAFMEQGLGKTLTMWANFTALRNMCEVTLMVVIAPNSFKSGWRDEMKEHGFDYPFVIWESANAKWCHAAAMKEDEVIVVVNYEATRGDKFKQLCADLVAKHEKRMIVADESIKLGNYKSQQTKACIQMAKEFQYRRILSGKPITQGVHNLWGQLRFLGALSGMNYFVFRNKFCVMGGYKMKQVIGVRNEDKLQELLREYTFLARKKEYAAHLPPKSWTTRFVPLHTKLQRMYEEMEEDMLVEVEDGAVATADMVLTRLLRQSQIAAGFVVDEDGVEHDLVSYKDDTRLQSVGQVYEEMDSKLIVVCQFKRTVQKILDVYQHLNPAKIVGGMTTEEIDENKRRFNDADSCRLMILTKAAKYGHTLHAEGKCYTMYFLENTYSLDDRSQLEDRPHREGQTSPVLYIDPYSTPENKRNVKALQRKESVAARILGYKPEMFEMEG